MARNNLQKVQVIIMKNVYNEHNTRLINWINSHMDDWEKICGLKYISIEEMRRLINVLNQEGFFELVEVMTTRWYAEVSNKKQD